jgi:hypothetical protein
MVQDILSAMNSDEVNSITDTVESLQVANEIRTTFRELYSNREIATFKSLINLDTPADTTTPHIMTLPDNVQDIEWIKYRDFSDTSVDLSYVDVVYLTPEEFITRIVESPTPASSVDVTLMPSSPATYPIRNDKAPSFYTILDDDQTLVFDSFDASEESYLTSSSVLAWGNIYKTFTLEDDFVPPIEANLFPHFLHECRTACFINIKEVANSFEAARARRQLIRSQTRVNKVPGQHKGILTSVDYSRKR